MTESMANDFIHLTKMWKEMAFQGSAYPAVYLVNNIEEGKVRGERHRRRHGISERAGKG